MALVEYITTGDSPTAARMNGLFSELDERTALALDDHNILYLLGTSKALTLTSFAPFMGPAFVWASGVQLISGYWGGTYDHSNFLSVVASSPVGTPAYWQSVGKGSTFAQPYYNTTEKWVRLHVTPYNEFGILRNSLEAHRIEFTPPDGVQGQYWVVEVNGASFAALTSTMRFVERRRRTVQAELILEGVTTLDFLARWNKYDFFRIHNCNGTPATVNFKSTGGGTIHSVQVPAYGSKCVRRTSVDGEYTNGFSYFQRFLPGDPRFFKMGTTLKGGGNNVVCPAVVVPWVNSLLGGKPFNSAQSFFPPTVVLDMSVRAPLPPRSAALYGDTSNGSTLIGDLLHHKGPFWDVGLTGLGIGQTPTITTTVKQFNGYADIVANMAAQGVTVQVSGDDMQLKATDTTKQHDWACFGTNLFATGSSSLRRPYLNAASFVTLDRHMPDREFYPLKETTRTVASSYTLLNGSSQAVNFPLTYLEDAWDIDVSANKNDASIIPHEDTINTVIANLGTLCGNEDYPDGSSSCTSWANLEFHLGGSGLWLTGDRETTLTALPSWTRDVWPALEGWEVQSYNKRWYGYPVDLVTGATRREPWVWSCSFADNILTQQHSMHFELYGWGNYDNTNNDNGQAVGPEFLPPGLHRRYGDAITYPTASPQRINSVHCDFRDPMNSDGLDIAYKGKAANKTHATDISLLTPWSFTGQNTSGNTNPDAPFDLTTSSLRVKFYPPMQMVANDHLRGAWRNLTTGSDAAKALYWKTNRSHYIAGTILSDAPGQSIHRTGRIATIMYGFFRMQLAAEHYNCLAEKVNQMVRYKPLNWIDHGVLMHPTDPDSRLRCYPNNYGLTHTGATIIPLPGTSAQIRPATQYARYNLNAIDAQNDDVAITAAMQAAGLLRTMADLPASFATARARAGQNMTISRHNETVATDTVTPAGGGFYNHEITVTCEPADFTFTTAETGFVRTDLRAVNSYSWAAIDDVKAYAEARGYKFIHTVAGVPLLLKEFSVPQEIAAILRQPPGSRVEQNTQATSMVGQRIAVADSTSIQSRFYLFAAPSEGRDLTEWMASLIVRPYGQLDSPTANMLCHDRKADVFTRAYGTMVLQFDVPEQFRKVYNGGSTGNNGVSGTYGTIGTFPNTGDLWCFGVYVRDYSSTGIACNSKLILAPTDSVTHTENFSATSGDAAWAKIISGPQYIPFEVTAKPSVISWPSLAANSVSTYTGAGYKVVVGEDHLAEF